MSSADAARDVYVWRSLGHDAVPGDLPKGLDRLWHRAAGLWKRQFVSAKSLLTRSETILGLEQRFARKTDDALRTEAEQLRASLRRGRATAEDMNLAFALIREGSQRVFGFRHHAVQVAGALAMCRGCIAEMATGEGKTLTATLPAMVAGWRGRGCHVITVNDYLAARDSEEMGKLYRFFHLKVKAITQESTPDERRRAYAADITYLTNKEAAADYLRDRLALGENKGLTGFLLTDLLGVRGGDTQLVQRGLEFALIDEADSVLIDEAVTPLIISSDSANKEQEDAFPIGCRLAERLREGRDYSINWKYKEIEFTSGGRMRLQQKCRRLGGVWIAARRREEIVHQALTARHFFKTGSEYIIDEGKVVIVDESTGRLMPDRSWRDGLHQAVEAKEKVEVTPAKETLARISFQRYFRLYAHLAGMTGTGSEAAGEFWHVYRLPVVPIPTHRPCLRIMHKPVVCSDQEEKWKAVMAEVIRIHAENRPILVGTRSIGASERLSAMLAAAGLEHQVLNAVHHRQEAEIVARAGQPGKITVATNMAGRGTDIKLRKEAEALGGLHVIATERHMSYRIDRQLYGRCSRQGDPGSAIAIVSMDDELPRRFSPLLTKTLRAVKNILPIPSGVEMYVFTRSERKAEKMAFKQRQGVLQSDTWLQEQLGFAGEDL